MAAMMFRSIRTRLILSYVLLTVFVVGLVSLLGMALVRSNAMQREEHFLLYVAETVQQSVSSWTINPQAHQAKLQTLAETVSNQATARVRILDRTGHVWADSGSPNTNIELRFIPGQTDVPAGSSNEDAPATPLLVQDDIPIYTVYMQSQGHRSERVKTVLVGNQAAPDGSVEISEGPDLVSYAVENAWQAFIVAGSAALVAAILIGLWASRKITAPLLALTQTVQHMRGGDLSARAPVLPQDEVGLLAGQFNQMAAELNTSFHAVQTERDTLRRFVADASHELRTPLTALTTYNELLQDQSIDPGAKMEFVHESQAQIDRLTWIVHNLLDLSRLDAGLTNLEMEAIEVSELLTGIIHGMKPQADQKGVALAVQVPGPEFTLRCNRPYLEIALANLLENAVKFAAPGGKVETGVERRTGDTHFWVKDDGPGIAAEDLPYIFDRFYRGRSHNQPGSGLGLAIVKSVVEAHGGRVAVESAPGQGTCVELILPQCVTPLGLNKPSGFTPSIPAS